MKCIESRVIMHIYSELHVFNVYIYIYIYIYIYCVRNNLRLEPFSTKYVFLAPCLLLARRYEPGAENHLCVPCTHTRGDPFTTRVLYF